MGRESIKVVLIGVLTAGIGAVAASQISIPSIPPAVHDVRPGLGVKTIALSDYLPSLAGLPDIAELMKSGLGAFLR